MSKDPAQMLNLKELFQAAQQDDFEAVRDYLQVVLHEEEGGSQKTIESIVETKTKNSLLHYACDNGNLDACKYLLMVEGVASAFLNEINAFGHTPLFYAASSGNLSLVKWLISNGADIDTDYSDRSDIVPRHGDLGIFTPLQIACFRGHEGIANFLVECNAELSGTRRNGKTPLHFASAENRPAIVKLLIEAGADVHACDSEGKTPVDVANSAVLPLLLPDEYDAPNADDNDLETGSGDNDDDDEFEGNDKTKRGMEGVKNAFGAEIARAFRSKTWKTRVGAITDASMCFQNKFKGKNLIKMFDGACCMMELALQDAVSQVASSCCTSLLKVAFNAVMSEKDFHTKEFHEERPVIHRIASALLLRGAGSNEKDSSEAVSSLLFLICKSTDITRHLTSQISQMMSSSTPTDQQNNANSSVSSGIVSWRHQLVAIKILNAIANQYRMDEKASGLNFAKAMNISMLALEHSSVHVRTSSIDLLVQCLVIRCEESEMKGTPDAIYEHTKNWCESLFKQNNQQLKPSIQAKINTGLKNALQKSKRLSNRTEESSQSDGNRNGLAKGNTAAFDIPTAAVYPRSKASQREDDLPYAEPIQGHNKDLAVDMLECFGEKATRCLFSNAWAPRVEALSYVQYLVETRQLSFDRQNPKATVSQRTLVSAMQTTLMQALQDRVNSVFEAGVSLLMEVSIAFDSAVASPADVTTMNDLVRPLIPRLLVKLGDSKNRLHVTTEDVLLLLSRQTACIGPVFLLEEMIACDRNSSPQALSATYLANKMALVSKLMLEFGIQESSSGEKGLLPIRNVLQLALQVSEHKDQNVRLMSLQIVADTMQVARSAAMPFLDALARSSRQKLISKLVERGVMESDMLMDEVDDFEIPAETARPGTSGAIRPPTASGSSTKHRPALANTSLSANTSTAQSSSAAQSQPIQLPYGTALTNEQKELFANIIQGFGEELVRCLLDKAWAQREAAIREVERQVVCCANGRAVSDTALPKTLEALGMLAQVLEIGLNDTVARVFQCALRLFQVLATEFLPLVSSEHQYVDEILENVVGLVLQKLGDTKQRLRQDCFTLLHSMASLGHVGHARMCKMLAEKYHQLSSSSNAVAASPLVIGELLRLFTMLVREAPGGENHQQPDLSLILGIVGPALENKHVDVRNAAITTYVTIYEATNGGTNDSYGAVDLNSFLAELKPSMRETITRSVVQITKALPTSSLGKENDNSSRPEIDSGRKLQRSLGVDAQKLQQICTAEITELLTSPSGNPAQRCLGVDKLVDYLVASEPHLKFKGAWETCCLLVKQLTLDTTPTICLAALELFQLLINPPTQNYGRGESGQDYAIPWGEWGVHLVLGSTIRSVVQQSANESVRVRSKVRNILRLIAGKSAVGKNAVCNAILSAPEQSDMSGSAGESISSRKIALTKLRWQFSLRLELLYEFLVVTDSSNNDEPSARRKSTNRGTKSSSDPLGLENVVPFLGSCATHPSPLVKTASAKIMRFLQSTCDDQLAAFVQASCSPALQRRLQALMAQAARGGDEGNNADHFDADRTTCVRGSRASHVRRVAALRPPRSVPVEEKQMMVDVFPPPNSAPGKSRRNAAGDEDDDSMNDGNSQQPKSKHQPIWLEDKSGSSGPNRKTSSNDMFAAMSFDDGEPEGPTMGVMVGGGAAGLMKARRKTNLRGNSNNDEIQERNRYGVY